MKQSGKNLLHSLCDVYTDDFPYYVKNSKGKRGSWYDTQRKLGNKRLRRISKEVINKSL